MAELRPDLSPYRYAFNNPISFTDPTGMYEGGDYYDDSDRGYGDDRYAGNFEINPHWNNNYNENMSAGERDLSHILRDVFTFNWGLDIDISFGSGNNGFGYSGDNSHSENDFTQDMSQENGSNDMMHDANAELAPPGNCCSNRNVRNINDLTTLDRAMLSMSTLTTYFENNNLTTYYIKPETGSEPVKVGPGQIYTGRIDGFASKETGVVKVSDFISPTVNPNGAVTYKTSIFQDIYYKASEIYKGTDIPHYTPLNNNDLIRMQKNGDHGWDALFNSIK